ncbi:MAG: bifunctional phosphopantothenoylcysteine decarboxylase/phosphopantothenate--cysteine ligase CoaBC [Thermoplasmata archaeon]|nr:bifunctional phosphopantothenoylcysteine decarboxylase/phosphopantothenate--cysteine ligase CoaBC [Thermoplasmata archaeon]
MHPSRAIQGRRSRLLSGRRIVLGVSGSIAAIEVPRIIRELIRHGATVQVVMSPESTRIVTPEAITFASGSPPITQLTGGVEHVTLLGPGEGRADLLLIAPATANTIAKVAHGIDDTPVTSCASVALGGGVPILIAPAMHANMGMNPAVRENLAKLRDWGVGVIEPQSAEGEEKIATPEDVAAAVLHRLVAGPWAGRRVVIIGGASREPIDEVRSITNESSGETAVALAVQAHFRGAETHLWAGGLRVPVPDFLRVVRWGSVSDLAALARRNARFLAGSAAVLVPAALSDFSLAPRKGKISSSEAATLSLALTRAPKLLPLLRRIAPPPTRLVGFKLEVRATPAQLAASARLLQSENHLDEVVANNQTSMGGPMTEVLVVTRRGDQHWVRGPKSDVAGKLLDDLGRDLALPASKGGGTRRASRVSPRQRPSRVKKASPRRYSSSS